MLTECTWHAFRGHVNRMKQSLNSSRKCLSHVFLLDQQKNYWCGSNFTYKKDRGSMTCYKMRWAILLVRKQKLSNCKSFKPLFTCSSIQTRGTGNSWRIVRILLTYCLKNLYLARMGRPDIFWSVNWLAISVTKWTQACDRRLARLTCCIHHTNDHRQYCHVGNTAMCKKQTSLSHSPTESEAMSLVAGLRVDGLLPLDLCDIVIEVLRTTKGKHSIWSHKFGETWADPTQPYQLR